MVSDTATNIMKTLLERKKSSVSGMALPDIKVRENDVDRYVGIEKNSIMKKKKPKPTSCDEKPNLSVGVYAIP